MDEHVDSMSNVHSALSAEAWALIKALKKAQEKNFDCLHVFSDS